MKYEIYTGSRMALRKIRKEKIPALNPRTMKYQSVGKDAKFTIKKNKKSTLYTLYSNQDIRRIAERKGLIL